MPRHGKQTADTTNEPPNPYTVLISRQARRNCGRRAIRYLAGASTTTLAARTRKLSGFWRPAQKVTRFARAIRLGSRAIWTMPDSFGRSRHVPSPSRHFAP